MLRVNPLRGFRRKAMPKYRVKSDINAGQYKPGDIIELSEAEAAAMPWAVAPLEAEPQALEPAQEPHTPVLKKYKVLAPFQYQGEKYQPGDMPELPDDEAAKREGKLEEIIEEAPAES